MQSVVHPWTGEDTNRYQSVVHPCSGEDTNRYQSAATA